MEYPSGDPTGATSTMSTENPSSNPRFHPSSDPDVIKVGSQEAQGSLQIYLIFLILHIISSLSSRQRSLQTRQQGVLRISHIRYMRPVIYFQAPDRKFTIKRNASKSRQLYLNILAMDSNTFLFNPVNPKIGHKLHLCMYK